MSMMSAAKKVAVAKTKLAVKDKAAAKARLASKARLQSLAEEDNAAVSVWSELVCGPIPLSSRSPRRIILFREGVGRLVLGGWEVVCSS